MQIRSFSCSTGYDLRIYFSQCKVQNRANVDCSSGLCGFFWWLATDRSISKGNSSSSSQPWNLHLGWFLDQCQDAGEKEEVSISEVWENPPSMRERLHLGSTKQFFKTYLNGFFRGFNGRNSCVCVCVCCDDRAGRMLPLSLWSCTSASPAGSWSCGP